MFWILLVILVGALAYPYVSERRLKPMDQSARRNAEGQFTQLSQGVTHYDWIGPLRGPVAVCVHGLTTPSFIWRGLAQGLGKLGYRVLIYDLYGRGYSDRPSGLQNSAFFLRQLNDLLEDQGVEEDFTLVGYSMGGAIATAFTAAHPDRVRQLVLLAPGGMGIRSKQMAAYASRTPVIGDWLMLARFPLTHRRDTETERHLPSSVDRVVDRQQAELNYRGFVPAVLSSLRGILARPLQAEHKAIHRAGVPVLAIWGREDNVVPLSSMGTLTEWSRSARQEVIEGAGHGLTYTHTDAVLDVMCQTLREGLV
jgi:pimeloyl-ACP methyl ester carboxylesterase